MSKIGIYIRRDKDKKSSSYFIKNIGFATDGHRLYANFNSEGEETGRLVFDSSTEMKTIISQQYRKLTLVETAILLLEKNKLLL
jgi:hypothetical protein